METKGGNAYERDLLFASSWETEYGDRGKVAPMFPVGVDFALKLKLQGAVLREFC